MVAWGLGDRNAPNATLAEERAKRGPPQAPALSLTRISRTQYNIDIHVMSHGPQRHFVRQIAVMRQKNQQKNLQSSNVEIT